MNELRSLKSLEKCQIAGSDGAIGELRDFYFDEESWVIRYLVVRTGEWLNNRSVLISPYALREGMGSEQTLRATLTREQVASSPRNDREPSMSRDAERGYIGHYGYPMYWQGSGLWGNSAYPGLTLNGVKYPDQAAETEAEISQHVNPHLRSCNAITHYYLHASDGAIGHIEGYLIDARSWAIRFLVVNTSNWWVGHHVLIAPEWIERISWLDSTVTTDLTKDAIRASPPYEAKGPLNAVAEASLYQHYTKGSYESGSPKRQISR